MLPSSVPYCLPYTCPFLCLNPSPQLSFLAAPRKEWPLDSRPTKHIYLILRIGLFFLLFSLFFPSIIEQDCVQIRLINMDAYSMSHTSPDLQHMSRIYQDLRSIHFQSISGLSPKQFEHNMENMASKSTVRHYPVTFCVEERASGPRP